MSILDKYCGEVNGKFNETIAASLKDGKLSLKNKELIALAIGICVRCQACIEHHVKGAVEAGCTMEEIAEMVEVCILMQGGPGTAFGTLALTLAEEMLKG